MKALSRFSALFLHVVNRFQLKNPNVAFTNSCLGWLGIDYINFESTLHRDGFKVFSMPTTDLWSHPNAGQPCPAILRDALRYAVAVETEEVCPDLDIDRNPKVQIWSDRLADRLAKTEVIFERIKPKLVLLVQGYEPDNAVVRAAAIKFGIPLLAVENTALNSRMLWDNVSALTTNRNLAANYYWRYRGSINRDIINEFIDSLISGLRGSKSAEHVAPIGTCAPGSGRPNVLFLGQVFTDSSLVFGLGAWRSPLDVMESAVQWCQRHGYRLIIKLHPKESTGLDPIIYNPYNHLTHRKMLARLGLMAALDANNAVVDAYNELDTYSLIAQSEITITINSQAGLESALLGKPTVVCGDSFYRGLGFTIDVNHPLQFDLMMDHATHFKVPAIASEFAYIYYERYCRPKTVQGLVDLVKEQF